MGENSMISRSLHYQLEGLASVLTRFLKSDGHCSTANRSVKCKSVLGNSAVNPWDCVAFVVDEWMNTERWWNGTDRVNWGTGRNMSLWHFVHHTSHWWNDSDRGKMKFSEINQSECHFFHHKSHWWNESDGETQVLGEEPITVPFYPQKSHMDWPGIKSKPLRLDCSV